MGRGRRGQRVRGEVDRTREGGEHPLDLAVTLVDQPLVVPVRVEGLAEAEEVLRPIVP